MPEDEECRISAESDYNESPSQHEMSSEHSCAEQGLKNTATEELQDENAETSLIDSSPDYDSTGGFSRASNEKPIVEPEETIEEDPAVEQSTGDSSGDLAAQSPADSYCNHSQEDVDICNEKSRVFASPRNKKIVRIVAGIIAAAALIVGGIILYLLFSTTISVNTIKDDVAQLADLGTFARNDYVTPSQYEITNLELVDSTGDSSARTVHCVAAAKNRNFEITAELDLVYKKEGLFWKYTDHSITSKIAKAIAGIDYIKDDNNGTCEFDEPSQTCRYTFKSSASITPNWLVSIDPNATSVKTFWFDGEKWVEQETSGDSDIFSCPWLNRRVVGSWGDSWGLNPSKECITEMTAVTITDANKGSLTIDITLAYETPLSQDELNQYEEGYDRWMMQQFSGHTVTETRTYSGTYNATESGAWADLILESGQDTGQYLPGAIKASFENNVLKLTWKNDEYIARFSY